MQNSRFFIRIVVCFIVFGLVLGSQAALAQENRRDWNRLLQGDYAFTQINTCVETAPGGFDRDTLQLQEEGEITTFATRGVTSFDGNGSVSVSDGEGMVIFHNQTSVGETPVLAPVPFTCEGTYLVADDLSFEMEFDCFGEAPPFLENGPAVLNGQISRYGKTLIFTGNEPVIEELLVPGVGVIGERICVAIATDIRAHRIR